MERTTIQSLWIGPRLSAMEQLSIRSYLAHGYPFHLYTYRDVAGVPRGTTILSANEILPEEEVFCYQHGFGKGSFAAFANGFRYKLLLERGGWWADLDSVCTRPLDFSADHVVGLERVREGGWQINNGMIKAPAGSPVMAYCWQVCRQVDREKLVWGQIGPRLITAAVGQAQVPVLTLDPTAFYPIDYWQVWQLIREERIPTESYAIHLWHSQWNWQRLDPDAKYRSGCIYEQLKRRYGVQLPADAASGPTLLNFSRYQFKQFRAGLRQRTFSKAA